MFFKVKIVTAVMLDSEHQSESKRMATIKGNTFEEMNSIMKLILWPPVDKIR